MLFDCLSSTRSSTSPIFLPAGSVTFVPMTRFARMADVWPVAVVMSHLLKTGKGALTWSARARVRSFLNDSGGRRFRRVHSATDTTAARDDALPYRLVRNSQTFDCVLSCATLPTACRAHR